MYIYPDTPKFGFGTAFRHDPLNMVQYDLNCINRRHKKPKGYMKNNKRK